MYIYKRLASFSDLGFRTAFKTYFAELGISVRDWEGLFAEMGETCMAFVHCRPNDEVIGFLLISPMTMTSDFFRLEVGFIRELWVHRKCRGQGYGSGLLETAESYFRNMGISCAILTTDTAESFYLKNGYRYAPHISARNGDNTFVKAIL